MIKKDIEDLYKIIPEDKIFLNEPMSRHTSFKIGGPAEVFIKVKTIEELKSVIDVANKNNTPLYIIGNGSNLLVKDEGIEGIVLKLELDHLKIDKNNNNVTVTVGSGVMMGLLAQKLMQEGITGFEEL